MANKTLQRDLSHRWENYYPSKAEADYEDDLKVEAVVATAGVMKSMETVKKVVNGSAELQHKWKNTAQGADSPGQGGTFQENIAVPRKGSNLSFPTLGLQPWVCGGEQNIAKSESFLF
ncbi:unnamed protein product [Lepidochelys kempii]